jgi:hypothetical protein
MGVAATPAPALAAAPAEVPVPSGPALDESLEIWLIRKDKLDFGPFSMAEVKRQIMRGDIASAHLIIDSETGKARLVKDHPYLARFVHDAEASREERHKLEANQKQARRDRHRAFTLLSIFLIVAAAATVAVIFWIRQHRQEPVVLVKEVPKSDSDMEQLLKGLSFEFPKPTIKARKSLGKGKRAALSAADDFDEPTRLGDASQEGGEEQLSPEQIQSAMNSSKGKALAFCIAEERRRNPMLHEIALEFILHGTGQVTAVRVNGQKGTPLASCMFQKMRAITFPKYNGPKMAAGFNWNIK